MHGYITLARLDYIDRKRDLELFRLDQIQKTGYDLGYPQRILGWIIIHVLYVWDTLWAIVKPVLQFFINMLIQIAVTIISTLFIFYLIYLFFKQAFS